MGDALTDLMDSFIAGAVRVEDARRLATDIGRRADTTPQMARTMARVGLEGAEAGNWRRGLDFIEIGHAAAAGGHGAEPEDRQWAHAWLATGSDLLSGLHMALLEVGDLRLYRRAVELGEELLPTAGRYNLPLSHGLVELDLGTLILDVYSRFPPEHFRQEFNLWIIRAQQGGHPSLGSVTLSDWPEPLDGLRAAEVHIRRALPLIAEPRKGRALKALAQTIEWRGYFGDDPRTDELHMVARQALDLLDPDDAEARLYLVPLAGGDGDEDDAIDTLEGDWPLPADEIGQSRIWDALQHAVDQVGTANPERALRLLDRQRQLSIRWADQAAREQHWRSEVYYFSQAYGRIADDFELALDRAQRRLAAVATETERRAAIADACQVMLASTKGEREDRAILLIRPVLAANLGWRNQAVAFLAAAVLQNAGVNGVRVGEPDLAISRYALAADILRQLGLTASMVSLLQRIGTLLRGDARDLDQVARWLAMNSLAMETADPRGAPWAVLGAAEAAIAAAGVHAIEPDSLVRLIQVAKGRRFAAQLAAGIAESPLDERVRQLLAAERDAEAAVPPDTDPLQRATDDLDLDDEMLLAAWVDPYEDGPSETPADRLANVRRAVERYLTDHPGRLDNHTPLGLDEIRRRLNKRTALVLLFTGEQVGGDSAIWSVLIGPGIYQGTVIGDGTGARSIVYGSSHERNLTLTSSALPVVELRMALREDPGPLEVSRDADEWLRKGREAYVGMVDAFRPQLSAAGVDHLLVVPHGSLHHLPVHLLRNPAGEPLAAEWTVTYLLNLAQLGAVPRVARRDARAVFGLTYRDQPLLPRLDDSEAEAREIARTLATEPRLDAEATPEAVLAALRTSRYVHLRAHGRMDVDAPSMHTVFLGGGRLRAYEILGSDLRGLELVTLGACETALGRLDAYDNPRGLPAALLRAGAGAVIGTLWPVLAGASTAFFVRLYQELTTTRSDVVDAFAAAQRATRQAFPQYRDWGAFYLIGGQ